MAFDWGCGFELNTIAASGIEVNAPNGTPTISSSVKRSGAYSMRTSSLVGGAVQGTRTGLTGGAVYFVQFALCLATAPNVDTRILVLNDNDAYTTPLAYITLKTDATLTLHDEDGQIGSASAALPADGATWNTIEIKIDRSAAAGSHIVEGRLNLSVFATASNRDISANVAFLGWGGNLATDGATVGDWYWDDIIANTNAGSFMNSYPGGAKIIHLRPDGAGDNSGWTGSYTDINEVTPNDATNFVSEGPAADTIDVTLDATPSELTSDDTINGAFIGYRVSLSSIAGADPRVNLRLKAAPGGTTDETANLNPNTASWVTNGPSNKVYSQIAVGNNSNYEQPGGSSPWTKAALDTAQIGARISTTDTDLVQITTMWLLVVFTSVSVAASAVHPVFSNDEIHGLMFGGQVVR